MRLCHKTLLEDINPGFIRPLLADQRRRSHGVPSRRDQSGRLGRAGRWGKCPTCSFVGCCCHPARGIYPCTRLVWLSGQYAKQLPAVNLLISYLSPWVMPCIGDHTPSSSFRQAELLAQALIKNPSRSKTAQHADLSRCLAGSVAMLRADIGRRFHYNSRHDFWKVGFRHHIA